MTLYKGPPKIFILGCATLLIANLLGGAIGHKWIAYLGFLIGLPLAALGIRDIFRRLGHGYMDELARLRGKSAAAKDDIDHGPQ